MCIEYMKSLLSGITAITLVFSVLSCKESPPAASLGKAQTETDRPPQLVEIFAKYNENQKLVIHSGLRSYETDIDKNLLRATIIKIVPYEDKHLLYIRRNLGFSLYIINPSQSEPLLTPIETEIYNSLFLGGAEKAPWPNFIFGSGMFLGVTAQGELEMLNEGVKDPDDADYQDKEYPGRQGHYNIRLFFKLKNGKLHCALRAQIGAGRGLWKLC